MKIKLRKKKLRGGKHRLYIEYYDKGLRTFEFLDYSVYDKPKNHDEREHNKLHLKIAQDLLLKRTSDHATGKFSINTLKGGTVANYMVVYEKNYSKDDIRKVTASFRLFNEYLSKIEKTGLLLRELNAVICDDFAEYLKVKYSNQETASGYFQKFKKMLKRAAKERLLTFHPLEEIEVTFRFNNSIKKVYTSPDDLHKFYNAKGDQITKFAYLFCVNTGLGRAELKNERHPEKSLRWKHIKNDEIVGFNRAKTGKPLSVDLTPDAIMFMGERKGDEDLVFDLPSTTAVKKNLKYICEQAGIPRVTFHSARHNFATNLISITDPDTVAKIMGSTVRHVQRYLHEIKKKKKDALMQLPSVLNKPSP